MKRFEWNYCKFFLLFLIWLPLSARKCCKVPVAQSQLGCINAELITILNKVCKIIPLLENKCDKNIVLIEQSDIPFTTPSSGHYCLAEDVTVAANDTGITINQEKVTLDLNGFHMTGGNGSTGIVVQDNPFSGPITDVVIMNGSVHDSGTAGIWLQGGNNVVIDFVVAAGNGIGFLDDGATNVTFKDSIASNSTSHGFEIVGNNHDFAHVAATGNGGRGLLVLGNTVTIHNSHFENNGTQAATSGGILLDSVTNFCLEQSTINRNAGDGISMVGTTNKGTIKNCCINGNLDSATPSGIGNGISAAGTTNSVTICQNTIEGNASIGITLSTVSPTTNIQVIENKVLSNGTFLSTAAGIDIGGGVLVNNNKPSGAMATSHTVILNVAQNNGNSPVGTADAARDTNYSANVVASPSTGSPADNGLVTNAVSTAVRLANLTI